MQIPRLRLRLHSASLGITSVSGVAGLRRGMPRLYVQDFA